MVAFQYHRQDLIEIFKVPKGLKLEIGEFFARDPNVKGTVTVTVTELRSSTMFSKESCSVGLSEKMSFQLRSELLATVVR